MTCRHRNGKSLVFFKFYRLIAIKTSDMYDSHIMINKSIQILPKATAERIAAGEVVERPASVIKELIENSIDAHATHICVHLMDGGKSLIEIIDNGHGMSPENLNLCLHRHATSKISELSDLEKLTSLGFRGEALASVAAVAQVEIISKTVDQNSFYKLYSHSIQEDFKKAEPYTYGHFHGSSHGTSIKVENIFSQIPARLKFLKTSRGEVAAIKEWMEKLSLTHPDIRFQLTHHDKILLDLSPQTTEDRIKTLFQEYDTFPLKYEVYETDDFKLSGYWFEGMSAPSTKNIIQIVNHRALKDRLIQQAILSPFKQSLLPGRFPGFILFVECNPSVVDFNVHPTKMEIRFEDSSALFHSIQKLGEKFLGIKPSSHKTFQNYFHQKPPETLFSQPRQITTSLGFENQTPSLKATQIKESSQIIATQPIKTPPDFIINSQYIGIMLTTYIALESGNEVILIDQHAAHERIRYELLKKQLLNEKELPSQTLLIPHTLLFNKDESQEILNKIERLESFGFEIELFKEDTLLIRSVPTAWGLQNIPQRVKNILDNLSLENLTDKEVLYDEHLFEKLASEACHSSVRAHDRLERQEALALVDQLFQCDHPWNCPHGRPTLVRIPEKKIEEWFLRKT